METRLYNIKQEKIPGDNVYQFLLFFDNLYDRFTDMEKKIFIIGHSQFEKIPLSAERQERLIQEQMDEIEEAIEEAKAQVGEHFTVKQLEKLRKSLKQKLEKLQGADRKDDVVTFEQLGVDRLFVDESQAFKNRAKRCA